MISNNFPSPSNDDNPKPPLSPLVRLLAIVFSMGVTLGSGLGYGFSQVVSENKQQQPSSQMESQRNGRAEYERLKPEMSLTEVEAILDRGTEINRSATTAKFLWENSDGSRITATFEGGKLRSKEQSGLR